MTLVMSQSLFKLFLTSWKWFNLFLSGSSNLFIYLFCLFSWYFHAAILQFARLSTLLPVLMQSNSPLPCLHLQALSPWRSPRLSIKRRVCWAAGCWMIWQIMEIIQSADILLLHAVLSQRSEIERKDCPPKKNPKSTWDPLSLSWLTGFLPSLLNRTNTVLINQPPFCNSPSSSLLPANILSKDTVLPILDKTQQRECFFKWKFKW